MSKKDSITISPKYGVNPSILHCECCGKEYRVAMLGKLKGDKEAPKDMYHGLCSDCKGVVDQGGVLIIEVLDGEQTVNNPNPHRTGRIVGVSKEFKKRNNIETPMVYMEKKSFTEVFGNVKFNK